MNKIKQGFDEKFDDFTQAKERIKSRVTTQQMNHKKPIRWHYSLIAGLLIIVVAGFLWTQLPANNMQSAKVATLSERYFEVTYFDSFYLSQQFNRSAENYEQVLHQLIQEAAMIDYAKGQGIVVSEEEKQARLGDYLKTFKESIKDADMAAFRYNILFEEFDLTAESYVELLGEQQLVYPLYMNKLFDQLAIDQGMHNEAYVEVLNEALQAFNAKYYEEIDNMLKDFHPVDSKSISATVETLFTSYGEFKIIELSDKLYFAEKNQAVNQLLLDAIKEIEAIQKQEKLGYLCYYTLEEYMKGAKKIAQKSEDKKDEELVQLLTILKQTVELY